MQDKRTELILLQFNKGILALIDDKFVHDMCIDDKFTHEIHVLETFNWEILDVILYCIPEDDKFLQLMFILHIFTLFISFVISPPEGTHVS